MSLQVVMGATCACSFGTAPVPLKVLPIKRPLAENKPVACILDIIPFLNVGPFAMCTSLANPTVAAATAAALGVLTPMPCIPVPTLADRRPTARSMIFRLKPGLQVDLRLGGCISIQNPGQLTAQLP
jgi:hypothetical protein